jgi:hypothetical protein
LTGHELDFLGSEDGRGDSLRGERGRSGDESERRETGRRPPGEPPSEPGSGKLRLKDDDFARPLSSFDGGEPPSSGGESSRGGLRRTDDEENVYVLLDDKPEPPSQRALPRAAPPIDADAPLAETAPVTAREEFDEKDAPLLDGLGVAPAGGGARGENEAAEPAASIEIAEEPADEEPEFLYPKKAAVSERVLPEHMQAARPRRPTVFVAAGMGLLLAVAGTILFRAFFGRESGPVTPQPPVVAAAPEPPLSRRPGEDRIGEKLRRALAWGLPDDALPEAPKGEKP